MLKDLTLHAERSIGIILLFNYTSLTFNHNYLHSEFIILISDVIYKFFFSFIRLMLQVSNNSTPNLYNYNVEDF